MRRALAMGPRLSMGFAVLLGGLLAADTAEPQQTTQIAQTRDPQ